MVSLWLIIALLLFCLLAFGNANGENGTIRRADEQNGHGRYHRLGIGCVSAPTPPASIITQTTAIITCRRPWGKGLISHTGQSTAYVILGAHGRYSGTGQAG